VVAYRDAELHYPERPPFDPDQAYPEYPFAPTMVSAENRVYAAVRQVLADCGLDRDHFNTAQWNPLGDLVPVGGTVLIKPNWVRHYHLRGDDLFSIITHPSVVRPLIDFAFKAVGPKGRIWVMDAPLFDTDFSALRDACRLDALESELRGRGVPLTVADLRSLVVQIDRGVVVDRRQREDWPTKGVEFDLAADSEMAELGENLHRVFGSDYDRRPTVSHHRLVDGDRQRHRYRIARCALEADLVVSVPKLKTHKKTGVTLNIKNMIGINTDKNYIPHYRVGSPSQGGDEFPDTNSLVRRLRRGLVRGLVDGFLGPLGRWAERPAHLFMKAWLAIYRGREEQKAGCRLEPVDVFYRTFQGDTYRTGNWWGNDTCWRCGVDINKILFYGTIDGQMADRPVRRYFSLIDGIVGGDGDGPMAPRARREGVLVAGFDPVSVDTVATQLMGFDPKRIRDQVRAAQLVHSPLTDPTLPIEIISNQPAWQGQIAPGSDLHFQPHEMWQAYLGAAP
jgi:uncharacterized protein (DUF362 family)